MLKEFPASCTSGLQHISINVMILSVVIVQTVVDDNDSSRFLFVYHRIFNITVKQLDYTLLLMNS